MASAFSSLVHEELCLFHAIVEDADSLHGYTRRDIRERR
jgi:hypothetical protein